MMAINSKKSDPLVDMRDIRIDGFSDDAWHQIIKGVDLILDRGEVLGLIGESGAGKSTLGLAAMGFAKPGVKISSGEILFDGMDLLKVSEAERRGLRGTRITYVAQSAAASFNPAHTLMDQCIETVTLRNIEPRADAKEKATEIFERLRLPNPDHFGDRYPHQVSGGQLQRAMIAMAMVSMPDLLIFDEPTTALDVTTQVEVLSAMRDIVREYGTAAIYITHDLAVVAQMADKIKVLRYGEQVEEADKRVMLEAPREDYTKSLWAVRSLYKEEEPGKDNILEIRNIDVYYGKFHALKSVGIEVPRGTTVSIVGESGSGKSTTARVITGLLPPDTGDVLYNGQPLPKKAKQRNKDLLRQIQMIYQMADTAMNPRQTVRDLIGRPLEFFLGMRGEELDARIVELLELIGLDASFAERLPSEMSGGQKQRICIARAIAAEPEIVICDEVTSSLDQVVQEGILKLLMELQKRLGITYVFITHDIATVEAISDRIVVMNQGEVVEQGGKREILDPPYPEYTNLLLSSVPQMNPEWLDKLLEVRAG